MSTEPTNQKPTSYIRTFAKDYAAVSGKELSTSSEKPTKQKKIKPPKPVKVKTPKPPKVKKEKKVKVIKEVIHSDESDSVITTAVSSQEQLAAEALTKNDADQALELPRIATGDIVQTAPLDERAQILARLKERVQLETPETLPPIISEPIPAPEPLPVFSAPVIKELPVAPAPIVREVESLPSSSPSPLHTYKSDFSDHIDNTRASTFSVLAAEKDATPKKSRPVKPTHKKGSNGTYIILGAILLIVLGAGGIVAAYMYSNKPIVVPGITASYLITPDSQVKLTGSGSKLLEALADQATQPLQTNTVELTYVDESTTTPQGVTEEPASGGAFISELQLQAPDVLLRNIDPSSEVGIIQAGTQTRPFFVVKVLSYERTFAGMLQWEPTMLGDLSALYPIYPENISSASSSENSIGQNQPTDSFVDEIVSNHSVRALKDISGRTIVLYGYADTQTLLLARDEAAFTLLLQKLHSSGN